jgi:hypothetical protein
MKSTLRLISSDASTGVVEMNWNEVGMEVFMA